jgi:hypothetical protein
VSAEPIESVTLPLGEPFPDVIQDLLQLSHVHSAIVRRALAGAILLMTGMSDLLSSHISPSR